MAGPGRLGGRVWNVSFGWVQSKGSRALYRLWINGGGSNLACMWGHGADRIVRNDAQMAACWGSVCPHEASFPSPGQTSPSDACCHCPALDLWATPEADVWGQHERHSCSLGGWPCMHAVGGNNSQEI